MDRAMRCLTLEKKQNSKDVSTDPNLEDTREVGKEEAERSPWLASSLLWPMLIGAGWLVYELTAQPGLAAPVACAKFGWNDAATAWWLRRTDPYRRRGRIHSWLYLSSGLWKVAITATVLMFVFVMVDSNWPNRGRAPAELIGASLSAFFGFFLSGLTALIAFQGALRRGIKVWLESAVQQSRWANVWPPTGCRKNRASLVLLSALIPPILVVAGGVVGLIAVIREHLLGIVDPNILKSMEVISRPLFLFIVLVAVLLTRDIIQRRIIADDPAECWEAQPPNKGQEETHA